MGLENMKNAMQDETFTIDEVVEVCTIWCQREHATLPTRGDILSCCMEAAWADDHMSKASAKARKPLSGAAADPEISRRPRKRKPSFDPPKEELVGLKEAGYTVKQMAEHYNVSASSVMNRLRDCGLVKSRAASAALNDADEEEFDEGQPDLSSEEIDEEQAGEEEAA